MKYTFLTIFILQAFLCLAQNNQGEVIYEDKRNIHKTLPPEMEEHKDRIPEFRTSKFKLSFNSKEAFYDRIKEEVKDRERTEGRRRRGPRGGRFGRGAGGSGNTYTEIATGATSAELDVFGKEFLVVGTRDKIEWKMTGEQKQVGDYLTMKATYQDSTQNIEAWFTPMIPVAIGPSQFGDLPGLILHMDINEGERTITATDIQLKELAAEAIKKPSKGEKVTTEEFRKIMEEKRKEMEAEFGGRPGGRLGRFGRGRG